MTAAYRDHANNRSGDRGALMGARAMIEIVLFTEFGGPLTKRLQLAQATSDRAVTVIEATCEREQLPRITEDPEDWRCKNMQPSRALLAALTE